MSQLKRSLRESIENTIRCLAVDAVERAGCGHPGAPMGLARPAFALWHDHLNFDPNRPDWPLRDRFILSAGHASMLIYSLLHLFGYDVSLADIKNFRQWESKTPGHPEYGMTPGIEVTTGPLGQGFAHGVGMALAGLLTRSRFGRDGRGPGYHRVYGIVSDGDLMEGVSYEAASLAGHLGLGNLIYLYDDNQITIDGGTDLSFSENVAERFTAQRWHVQKVDGQDLDGLNAALAAAKAEEARPSIIIMRTTIGFGSPNRAGTSDVHGSKLGAEETRLTKERLGWPTEPDFIIPAEVSAYMGRHLEERARARAEQATHMVQWEREHPALHQAWLDARARKVPHDLSARLLDGMDAKADATRKHGGEVLARLTKILPYMVGGSADLAGSAAPPLIKTSPPVGPGAGAEQDPFAGRNLYFGIREHAMTAITNGINLDGTLMGYCGTFLIFSDYMRPSIRLAALMEVRSTFVLTHDSIFLGEDGPTHQPVEHLDSLRAMPGLTLFRPADGVETAMAWSWVLQHARGPVALALTRQTVPLFARRADFQPEEVWRGAYKVADHGAEPRVVLVATGSEVPVACAAAADLVQGGIACRVVSLPCLELFVAQPANYQAELIPPDKPVVLLEAGVGESLRCVAGGPVLNLGVRRFGASAPYGELTRRFGFTPEAVSRAVAAFVKNHNPPQG